jgi:hypothetical protein
MCWTPIYTKTSHSYAVYLTIALYFADFLPLKLYYCSDHSNNNQTIYLLRKLSNPYIFPVSQLLVIAFMFPVQNACELTLKLS